MLGSTELKRTDGDLNASVFRTAHRRHVGSDRITVCKTPGLDAAVPDTGANQITGNTVGACHEILFDS